MSWSSGRYLSKIYLYNFPNHDKMLSLFRCFWRTYLKHHCFLINIHDLWVECVQSFLDILEIYLGQKVPMSAQKIHVATLSWSAAPSEYPTQGDLHPFSHTNMTFSCSLQKHWWVFKVLWNNELTQSIITDCKINYEKLSLFPQILGKKTTQWKFYYFWLNGKIPSVKLYAHDAHIIGILIKNILMNFIRNVKMEIYLFRR